MILDPEETKSLFLEVISRAKKKYSFSLENFCIMGDHYHLIIRPLRGASLSRIMQWIMSVFAMSYNRIHHLTGHCWGERFFSRIINTIQEYVKILEYIDENPVKARLVDSAFDWAYGGLAHRRRGSKGILDPLPDYIAVLLPNYGL